MLVSLASTVCVEPEAVAMPALVVVKLLLLGRLLRLPLRFVDCELDGDNCFDGAAAFYFINDWVYEIPIEVSPRV